METVLFLKVRLYRAICTMEGYINAFSTILRKQEATVYDSRMSPHEQWIQQKPV